MIQGAPCHRPMAKITEELGAGIMEHVWLMGGRRRLGKATSSVVLFLERVIRLGRQVRLGWLLYDFDRGRK